MEGNVLGIVISKGLQPVNHAQFTNDTILLDNVSVQIDKVFKNTLNLFLKAFGGLENSSKRCLYGWNYNPRELNGISHVLGFKVQT